MEARYWFAQAVKEFRRIANPSLYTLSALAAASGRAGIACQRCSGYRSSEAAEHFARAEELFSQRVRDPCVRAAYWYNRATIAFRFFRPQALWFLLCCLAPGLVCWWDTPRRPR
jgi:hypothetical protein